MATATHAYVVWHGSFEDHLEEYWQIGVRFMLVNSGTEPDHVGALPTFDVNATAVSRDETDWTISSLWDAGLGLAESISVDDWLNDQLLPAGVLLLSGNYISTKVTLNGVKVSPINGSGHVTDLRVSQGLYKSPLPHGPTDIPQLPAECSVVSSWITQRIGRKGRGRVYLPPTGSAVLNEDGDLAGAQTAHIVAGMVAFLEQTAITPTGPGNHWALPIVTGAPYTAYAVIDGVRVGSVIDSQRRRRRQLNEVYANSAVAYG
jgi:hypothetical protein